VGADWPNYGYVARVNMSRNNASQEVDGLKNAQLLASAPALYKALELATAELNAIRARDRGRPLQTASCTEQWWDELTNTCWSVLATARGEQQGGMK